MYSLDEACRIILGGVGAISHSLYQEALDKIAEMTDRTNDDQFKDDVIEVLRNFPCPLD